MTDIHIQRQAALIAQLRKDINQLVAASHVNQLNYSALHNTTFPVYDENGKLRIAIGKQKDGSYGVRTYDASGAETGRIG